MREALVFVYLVAISVTISVPSLMMTFVTQPAPTHSHFPDVERVDETEHRRADDSLANLEMMQVVANSSNLFGIDLFHELWDGASNVIFSPWSITSAMLVLHEGARGQTREEIANVFHVGSLDAWRPNYAGIYNRLSDATACRVNTANAFWHDLSNTPAAEFIEPINKYYCGEVRAVDFMNHPDTACNDINEWVASKTENMIDGLLDPASISPETRFTITNALYFAGAWETQFDPKRTYNATFHGIEGNATVPFMRHSGGALLNYMRNDILEMVGIPYEGNQLDLLVLIPEVGFDAFLPILSLDNIYSWETQMTEDALDIRLPSFSLDVKSDLAGILSQMGMPVAFQPGAADLSGIDGTRGDFISSVMHGAAIVVDEVGTKAAAATAGTTTCYCTIPQIVVDHPFIFLIQERTTGLILFLGTVLNV
ncbi:MAG: serpin family protein [Candidatus Lokiarchaeota archaeon]|nr:serpin family protein [Candidatus Lokiarchaeota archaeon]